MLDGGNIKKFHGAFYVWMIVIGMIAFLIEIVFAHICHSLLLNVGALFKVSQVILSIIQLISSDNLDEANGASTFGLGRIGVTAELMNCIFLYAMSFSLIMEGVKHIVDNLKFGRIEANLYNSTKPSLIHHQHFRIHRPDLLLYTGYISVFLNVAMILGILVYHLNLYYKTKQMQKNERNKCYSSNYVSTTSRLLSWRHILSHIVCLAIESFLILICGIIVNTVKSSITHYVDSIISLLMMVVCVFYTYPIARKSMEILIQNFPDCLDLQSIVQEMIEQVSDIVDIHNLHVWQHVPHSYVATMHIVLASHENYHTNMDKVIRILQSKNIDDITIQPEFSKAKNRIVNACLMSCPEDCSEEEFNNSFYTKIADNKIESGSYRDGELKQVSSLGSTKTVVEMPASPELSYKSVEVYMNNK